MSDRFSKTLTLSLSESEFLKMTDFFALHTYTNLSRFAKHCILKAIQEYTVNPLLPLIPPSSNDDEMAILDTPKIAP